MYIRFDELNDKLHQTTRNIIKTVNEDSERTLAEIIENYDFVVGSIECKHALMSILPKDAKIIVTSRFIGEPNAIFAIQKFYIVDFYRYLHESEASNDNQS